MVPSLTPYDLPFPQNWGSKCTPPIVSDVAFRQITLAHVKILIRYRVSMKLTFHTMTYCVWAWPL